MTGPRDYFVGGDWKAVCFQCGFIYHASQLKRHWQGYYVCGTCWEPRQPQDFVRAIPDVQQPPWVQPRPANTFGAMCMPDDQTAIPAYAIPDCVTPNNISPFATLLTPLRQQYVYLSPDAGTYCSSPNAGQLNISGDFRLILCIAAYGYITGEAPNLYSKFDGNTNKRCWKLNLAGDGALNLQTSANGIATLNNGTTRTLSGLASYQIIWIRVDFDANDGAGNRVATFYTANVNPITEPSTITWSLFQAVTTAGNTSIDVNSSDLELGNSNGGTDLGFNGRIYRAQLYSGIGASPSLRADCNPSDCLIGRTSWVSNATFGETYTLHGNAAIV